MGSILRFRGIKRGIIFLSLLLCHISLASDRPTWTEKAFWEDDEFYYYVGVATNAATEEEGRVQAHEHALAEAIQHLFGIETSMSRRAFISNDDLIVDEDLSIQMPKSFLVGVKVFNQYIERDPDSNRINVWRAISVPKSISRLLEGDTPKIFNRYDSKMGRESLSIGKLKVVTSPINAQIFLDKEPIGKSNGEFDRIGTGKYRLRIEKIGFEPIEREILISPDSPTELSLTLKPLFTNIKIDSDPSGAKIFQGKLLLGTTPGVLSLQPNQYKLKLQKEHFEPTFLDLNVEASVEQNLSTILTPLPGKLLIQTSPTGGSVYSVDGKLLGTAPLFLEKFPAGLHRFIFEHQGFPLTAQSIEVKPEESVELHHNFSLKAVDKDDLSTAVDEPVEATIIFGRGNIPLDSAPISMDSSKADKILVHLSRRLAVDNLVEEVAKSKYREMKLDGSRAKFWEYIKKNATFLSPSYTVKRDRFYLTTFAKIDLSKISVSKSN